MTRELAMIKLFRTLTISFCSGSVIGVAVQRQVLTVGFAVSVMPSTACDMVGRVMIDSIWFPRCCSRCLTSAEYFGCALPWLATANATMLLRNFLLGCPASCLGQVHLAGWQGRHQHACQSPCVWGCLSSIDSHY